MPDTDLPLAGHLNRALCDFVEDAGRRRALPTLLHLGHPDGELAVVRDEPWYDDATRADLVTRALDGLDDPAPLAWLTRSGALSVDDRDLRWCAATVTGYARHGLGLPGFHLLTRAGWLDLTTGERHEWYRVRPRRRVGPSA